jgi:hypothetical protein
MARWYEFSISGYEMDTLEDLRNAWRRIPNPEACNKIAEAHQYFNFQKEMILGRLETWSHSPDERENWFTPTSLALSARVGATNSLVIIGASIIECALRANAEHRNVSLHGNPLRRTFGHVLNNSLNDESFGPILHDITEDLEQVKNARDGIHLYANFGKEWQAIYDEEENKLGIIESLMTFFQELD